MEDTTKKTSRNITRQICLLVAKSLGSNSKGVHASEPHSVTCLDCVLGTLPKTGGKSAIIYNMPDQKKGLLSKPSAHFLLLRLTQLLSDSSCKSMALTHL